MPFEIEKTVTVGDIVATLTALVAIVLWCASAGVKFVAWRREKRFDRWYADYMSGVVEDLAVQGPNARIRIPTDAPTRRLFERMLDDGTLVVKGPGKELVGLPRS